MKNRIALALALALVSVTLLATVGCGGDSSSPTAPPPPPTSPILGQWASTSFVVDGVDQVPNGFDLALDLFADARYDLFAQNDDLGIICEGGATTCSPFGEFTLSGDQITFDPGEPEELTLSYAVNGDQLTLSGTIDGTSVTATFARRN